MELSTLDLAKARETARAILEELRLEAYLFEVEPKDDVWELKIECVCEIDGGWEMLTLRVPKQMLLDSHEDLSAEQSLIDYWRTKLAGCKLRAE